MTTIAKFGSWVWANFFVIWGALAFGAVTLYEVNKTPTATLDAKHWECTMAVPDGIGSRCVEYVFRGK